MIILYLFIALVYAFNATVIFNYCKESGEFAVIDLIHLILSPVTIINVFAIKAISHIVPVDYLLWKRQND
jgi:hypothetical protein